MKCSECAKEIPFKRFRQLAVTCDFNCAKDREKRLTSKRQNYGVRDRIHPLADGVLDEIKSKMEEKDLTILRLADLVGITSNTLRRILKENSSSTVQIRLIADQLGLSHEFVTQGMDITGIPFKPVRKIASGKVAKALRNNPHLTYHEILQLFPDELPSVLKKKMMSIV